MRDDTFYFACGLALLALTLILLGGCAHTQRTVSIACFASEDAKKAKQGVEGQFPLIVSQGTVLFYDEGGSLHRVKEAVCGVKGAGE